MASADSCYQFKFVLGYHLDKKNIQSKEDAFVAQ